MKVPTFTKPKHWLWLLVAIVVQAIIIGVCFVINYPFSLISIALIVACNIEITGAMTLGIVNALKK